MTGPEAKRAIVVSLLVSGVLVSTEHLANGDMPPLSIGIGVGVAGIMLLTGAEFFPEVAGAFGLLILTTATFVYGGPAFRALAKATGGTK